MLMLFLSYTQSTPPWSIWLVFATIIIVILVTGGKGGGTPRNP